MLECNIFPSLTVRPGTARDSRVTKNPTARLRVQNPSSKKLELTLMKRERVAACTTKSKRHPLYASSTKTATIGKKTILIPKHRLRQAAAEDSVTYVLLQPRRDSCRAPRVPTAHKISQKIPNRRPLRPAPVVEPSPAISINQTASRRSRASGVDAAGYARRARRGLALTRAGVDVANRFQRKPRKRRMLAWLQRRAITDQSAAKSSGPQLFAQHETHLSVGLRELPVGRQSKR